MTPAEERAYVVAMVDAAPPFSPTQIAKLRLLLAPQYEPPKRRNRQRTGGGLRAREEYAAGSRQTGMGRSHCVTDVSASGPWAETCLGQDGRSTTGEFAGANEGGDTMSNSTTANAAGATK